MRTNSSTVHQNRRWDEDYLTIKRIYDEGRLGRVFKIESRVHGSRGIPSDWRNQKAYGGGMVLDWGIHLLDQLLMMVKEPVVSVYADLDNVTNQEKPPCGCGGYSQTPANPCKHSLFSNFIPHDLPRFLANHGHFLGPQLASD